MFYTAVGLHVYEGFLEKMKIVSGIEEIGYTSRNFFSGIALNKNGVRKSNRKRSNRKIELVILHKAKGIRAGEYLQEEAEPCFDLFLSVSRLVLLV